MATVSATTDETTGLLENLSLDSRNKPQDAADAANKILPNEISVTPNLGDIIDPTMGYISNGYQTFYYGGYNGLMNEQDNYTRLNYGGVEMNPGVYHHGYGYAPYAVYPSPGSPAPTLGNEGHLYGSQHYQYMGPYYQQPTPSIGSSSHDQRPTPQGKISTSVASRPLAAVESATTRSNTVTNLDANRTTASASTRARQRNPSRASNNSYGRGVISSGHSSGTQVPRFDYDATSPYALYGNHFGGQHRPLTTNSSWITASRNNPTSVGNPNNRSSHFMGSPASRPMSGSGSATPGYINRVYPNNRTYSRYGSAPHAGVNFGSNWWDSRNGCGHWGQMMGGKYKPTNRNENLHGFDEIKRGPRGQIGDLKASGPVAIAGKDGNLDDSSGVVPDKGQYNQEGFLEVYTDAKFFIIKSYSEDDVHMSIKYSVWASTPNGNRKLDAAYHKSQEKAGGCPVFLFFSVNASGHFVGLAEMTGPVDFNKTVDYWQQSTWTGCFPVKWHIVKDVPNIILRHITLENNDCKPVTNSRDAQEVKLKQGLEMVKIFKEHASLTSVLDDFLFYETRRKLMLEKKTKILDGNVASGSKDIAGVSKEKTLEPSPSGHIESSSVVLKPSDQNEVANEVADDPIERSDGASNDC